MKQSIDKQVHLIVNFYTQNDKKEGLRLAILKLINDIKNDENNDKAVVSK
jgi:hypothetical protein